MRICGAIDGEMAFADVWLDHFAAIVRGSLCMLMKTEIGARDNERFLDSP
jgi:hypothetical protein